MRTSRPATRFTLATIASATLVIGLAACSGDSPDAPATTTASPAAATTAPAETPEPTEASTEETPAPAPAGEGTAASWARPVTTPGELLTTIEGEGFKVDIYQVDVVKATKTGSFVDAETNKPLIEEGDDLVVLNRVFTNTGTEPISLSFSLASVSSRYADWPYLQGMDGVSDAAIYEALGIDDDAIAVGAPDAPFVWEPGTTFATAENFKYQPGSPIDFTLKLTPADDKGDLLHDKAQEIEGSATIK